MHLTEVRINLCAGRGSRLKAFCALTFDHTFVIRDVKLIDGNDGLFLAMPSRKLCDHCPSCSEKNHLRARYCSNCGRRLNEERYQSYRSGNGSSRLNRCCPRITANSIAASSLAILRRVLTARILTFTMK
jgi:stage V sporulation protein G